MTEAPLLLASMTERGAPGHLAVIDGDLRLDYATLHDLVLRCVGALRGCGIGHGDRVGYLGLNSVDYVVLLQAALRIGAVTVAINWRLSAPEIDYIVADAGIALLVTEAARLETVAPAVARSGVAKTLLTDGRPSFRDWCHAHAPDHRPAPIEPGDVAVQLYTSGTTGDPKGALLSHGALSASLRQGAMTGERWSAWFDDDVALVAMPQFHIGGTAWTFNALNAGSTAVILGRADIGDILATVARERITKMFAVPAVLAMMLDHPLAATADLSSLRALLYGASPIPPDVLRRSMQLFPGASFVQLYGATETCGTIVYLPPEDHDVAGTPRMAGCGKPYPQVELKIVGSDGQVLAAGQIGEVLVRSPMLMNGYHRLPEATVAAFDGDWYRSGDSGQLDADGYLYLHDRVKDMIVSGGENIYPAEIENVLHDHPAVRDCAVIGVPDARWGEAVRAVVVRAAPVEADELIGFARTRLAGYKLPKAIDFVDELPRNPSGKILKRTLREPHWPSGGRQVA